jgi:tetratricopeptide (TPR) repeat protein
MTSPAQPTIARLSFTRLVIGACCLVLLSVCSLEAQEDLPHFDVNSALGEGYRLLNEGRFDRAKAVFENVIAHDPKNRNAIEGLVWVAFSSERYVEAGRAADRVRFLDPQDIGWTRKWIEVVWHDPDRRGEALAEARSLLINDKDDIETRLLLANLLSRESQTWVEADTEYDNVLERAPQNVDALIGRARLAIWTGDLDKAYRFLQTALAVDATNTIITEQIESIKRATKELSHALIGRARLAMRTGDLDKAYRFLQMALAVDPTNTIITEQIESINRATKELSHARMQLFVPLALIIIFLSIGIGYSIPELTRKVYVLLFLQVAVLMSLAALWVYVSPTAFVPNSN